MSTLRTGVLGIALLALGATGAIGGGLGNRGSLNDNRPFSWSGFYVGGNLGGAWLDADYLSNDIDTVGHSAAGVIGGAQVGARWQNGRWVFGLEGSYSWTHLEDTSFNPAALDYSSELRSTYMATVQVGYAWDRTLLYVKGGYAGGRVRFDSSTDGGPIGSVSTNANGWTIGAGLEHALSKNLSVGLEYDFIRLDGGASTWSASAGSDFYCPEPPPSPTLKHADYTADIQQVLLRVNYKFGRDEPVSLK